MNFRKTIKDNDCYEANLIIFRQMSILKSGRDKWVEIRVCYTIRGLLLCCRQHCWGVYHCCKPSVQPTKPGQRGCCPTVSMETLMRELFEYKPHVVWFSSPSLKRWQVTRNRKEWNTNRHRGLTCCLISGFHFIESSDFPWCLQWTQGKGNAHVEEFKT